MIRLILAGALALHGLIHLIGFVVPWRIAALEGFAYTTTALWSRIELGETGAKAVGVAWLVTAIFFLVAAVAVWQESSWAFPFTAGVAVGSLVLSVLGAPTALAGIVVNLAI